MVIWLSPLITFINSSQKVVKDEHILGNRTLEVKIATPKEEMRAPGIKKATRIFVARIPQSVDESKFRRHFEAFGEIIDLYMPKELRSKSHRGIGFITFQSAECVDNIMQETHELDGTTVAVDRATPKDEDVRHPPRRVDQGGYGAYNAYITAATRYAALGTPTSYDHPGPAYGRGHLGGSLGTGKKIFDPKRSGHRGFGFVTFADDGVADRVAQRSHEILGQEVAVDTAEPLEGGSGGGYLEPAEAYGPYGAYGSLLPYGRFSGSLGYDYGYDRNLDTDRTEVLIVGMAIPYILRTICV
uniref:RRM domain-containing protein n=1 Tax=Oryza barthii TaxID=65489 RepID=A0A0D3G6Y6_9ORYZ